MPASAYQQALRLVNALAGLDHDPEQNQLSSAINVLQAIEQPPGLLYLSLLYWNHPAVQDHVVLTCSKAYVEAEDRWATSTLENKLKIININLPARALETVERIVEALNVEQYLSAKSADKYFEIVITSVTELKRILGEKNIPMGSLHKADNQSVELGLPSILMANLQH